LKLRYFCAYTWAVLSDEEVAAIARSFRHVREPTQLIRYLDALLQDRQELKAQLDEVRMRQQQAFKHLDAECSRFRLRMDAARAYLDGLPRPRKKYGQRHGDDRH
jgi:hypothetical protein